MIWVLAKSMHLQYPLDQLSLREVGANLAEWHLANQDRVLLEEESDLE
jgi:hypothetical protein